MRLFERLAYVFVILAALSVSAEAQFANPSTNPPGTGTTDPKPNMDFDHKIVLNLTIVTPEGQPDRQKSISMKSLEDCWETAHAWVQAADIGKKDKESIGLAAGCGLLKVPSQNN